MTISAKKHVRNSNLNLKLPRFLCYHVLKLDVNKLLGESVFSEAAEISTGFLQSQLCKEHAKLLNFSLKLKLQASGFSGLG